MSKFKYQKGSASPKLNYYTLQQLQDRGDIGSRFKFVKSSDFQGIYKFDGIQLGIAHFTDVNTKKSEIDYNLDKKVILI